VNLFFTPVHLIGSVIGAYYGGIVGVAVSLVVVRAFFYNWRIGLAMNAVDQPVMRWHKDLYPYFASITVVVVISWLASNLLQSVITNVYPVWLIAIVAAGVVLLYNLLIRLVFPRELFMISYFLGATFPKVQRPFNKLYGLNNS